LGEEVEMPNIITPEMGSSGGNAQGDFKDVHFDYKYPHGLNLKPGTVLHDNLKNEILRRVRASHNVMSKRYDSWNDIDKMLTAYIPLSDEEESRKKKDETRPVSIVIPLAYQMLETLLTYQMTALLDRPICRYEGMGPEDVVGAILLEKVIDFHCQKSKVGLPLHTSWRDAFAYGLGVVSPYWNEQHGKRTVMNTGRRWSWSALGYEDFEEKVTEDIISFEGNALYNIDPYMYFPDPNVPAHDIQNAEFIAWGRRDNYPSLFSDELNEGSPLFNVQYLKHVSTGRSHLFMTDESARDKFGQDLQKDDRATTPVDVIYIHWHLIPKDWHLSSSEKPEKWTFALAADEIIISAEPSELNHNMFPVAVCAPDYDGYSVTPLSKLEVVYGQQELTNWLVNSHVANVMKIIKDVIVYDPSVVNPYDVEDETTDGKKIRVRRESFGKTPKDHVFQLPLQDVTRGNLNDVGFMMEVAHQGVGTVDAVRGIMTHRSERRSATEASGARTSALSRLERMARITGMQQLWDMAYMFAKNTQQLMSQELYVKTAGRWEQTLRETYGITDEQHKVRPMDILINYDVIPHDSTVPSGENLQEMVMLWQTMATDPVLQQKYEHFRFFQHIVRQMGVKNLYQFEKKGRPVQTQVQPTEQVMGQVQAGNMIPASEMAGIGV
jgi:hypothetical protein